MIMAEYEKHTGFKEETDKKGKEYHNGQECYDKYCQWVHEK